MDCSLGQPFGFRRAAAPVQQDRLFQEPCIGRILPCECSFDLRQRHRFVPTPPADVPQCGFRSVDDFLKIERERLIDKVALDGRQDSLPEVTPKPFDRLFEKRRFEGGFNFTHQAMSLVWIVLPPTVSRSSNAIISSWPSRSRHSSSRDRSELLPRLKWARLRCWRRSPWRGSTGPDPGRDPGIRGPSKSSWWA